MSCNSRLVLGSAVILTLFNPVKYDPRPAPRNSSVTAPPSWNFSYLFPKSVSPAFQKQCRALGNDFLVGLTMCIWRHCATVGTIVVWNIQFSDSFNSNPDKVECSVKMTELWPNWVDSDIRRSELGRTRDLIHFTGLISCPDKQMWWKLTLLTHLSSLSRPRLLACVSRS